MIMGDSKGVRNAIIALIILAIAIYFMFQYAEGYISQQASQIPTTPGAPAPTDFINIIASARGLFNIFLLGIGVLILLLIPIWIAKKRSEGKLKEQTKR